MTIKEEIRHVVDNNDSKFGRMFTIMIQGLIVISLVTFSLDTLPDLSQNTKSILDWIELITVGIFTLEYILRIVAAERVSKYVFSFYGVIDLLAILPFYIASGYDFRALRIFRLFRLLRILKLLRYSEALGRFHRALKIIKEELIVFGIGATMVLYISSAGIYYCENAAQPDQFKSIFHSFWWAVTTLTTVGYGDMYPVTIYGKLFTFLVLMVGLGLVAVPTGLIASALSKVRSDDSK